MKHQCPECESEDVYLCSSAYEQGTTHTTTTGSGRGTSTGYSPGTGYATGQNNVSVSTSSTHQTAFAKRASPPDSNLFGSIIWLVCSTILLWATYSSFVSKAGAPGFVKFLAWIAFLIGAAMTFFAVKGRPAYHEEMARWRKSWICARCGKKFIPEEPTKAAQPPLQAEPSSTNQT